jgi:hypothetical protein
VAASVGAGQTNQLTGENYHYLVKMKLGTTMALKLCSHPCFSSIVQTSTRLFNCSGTVQQLGVALRISANEGVLQYLTKSARVP